MSVSCFRDTIENHPIFKDLKKRNDHKSSSHRPHQLIHINDGTLFVWVNEESSLNVTNLSPMLDGQITEIQKLKCSPPPVYDVDRIIFNKTSTMVALIGKNGASVLLLPERWKLCNKEGQITYCKCYSIAERFFATSVVVRLLEAAWHPGSPNDDHLCVLLSDSTLRIFAISNDCQNPIQVHKLGHQNIQSSRFSLVSSRYSLSTGITENVVSFAFARPITVQEKGRKILSQLNEEISSAQLYPAYLLQGDGDVFILLTSVTENKYRRGILHGPLIMKPAAEDNYGVDSCSILVLDCTPTVLAIATSTGKVHHCIALGSDDDYDSDDEASEVQSTRSWPASVLSVQNVGTSTEFSAPTLYVYETVELDAEVNDEEEINREILDRVVTLYRDPLLYCRYHCCTKFGIHAVVLPWIDKITSFFEADDDDKDVLDDISQAQPCAVEHIVCTKPSTSSPECAVRGVTFATNPLYGPSLLCLTADNRCTALALLTVLKPVPPPTDDFLKSHFGNDASNVPDFEGYIRSVLRRDYTQPMLRYDESLGDTLVDSEACRLISRVTQIIRKEYVLKQKLANDAILRRAQYLKEQEEAQLEDLKGLQDKRQALMSRAGDLAEKYEDCRDCLDSLSKRLDSAMKLAQSKAPVLSKAEVKMSKDLTMMADKIKHLENKVRQVRAKYDYQTNDSSNSDTIGNAQSLGQAVNPSLVQNFKEILAEEGEKIEDLVAKVNQLKLIIDT